MENLRNFYPEIEPFKTDMLKVSDLHTIYVEQCGNPKGRPVVFLHGGPGGGVGPDHRRFFDPKHYHIILFDQRGSGKSTPAAELRENSTWELVKDIETIREHVGVKDWIVFGGSWGFMAQLSRNERSAISFSVKRSSDGTAVNSSPNDPRGSPVSIKRELASPNTRPLALL